MVLQGCTTWSALHAEYDDGTLHCIFVYVCCIWWMMCGVETLEKVSDLVLYVTALHQQPVQSLQKN
jgi:hypothetical protein